MKQHTAQEFEHFMSQLQYTNVTLPFFTDFDKCVATVEKIAMRLNQLNYLIGQTDMAEAVHALWEENPKVFSVLDILIAVRTKDKKKVCDKDGMPRLLSSFFEKEEDVVKFIEETGLKDILQKKKVKNLVDYVFGIEVGLDSNARKNRSGKTTEDHIEHILIQAGLKYRKEVYSNEYPKIKQALGEDLKRFDFVIETANTTYLLEVNFYSGGGSKLNEIARAYTELAPKIQSCDGFEFVWITDGIGWKSARNKLEEVFYSIKHIYNLKSIHDFISEIK